MHIYSEMCNHFYVYKEHNLLYNYSIIIIPKTISTLFNLSLPQKCLFIVVKFKIQIKFTH